MATVTTTAKPAAKSAAKPAARPTELRPATPADMDRVADILCRAYVVEDPGLRAAMMRRAQVEDTRVLVVGGEIVSVGRLLPLEVGWGGRTVGLGGIASLATPPDQRRRGYVSRVLRGMLGELRARKIPLSALYPFDAAFYRRYGWALASAPRTVRLPVSRLTARTRPAGAIVHMEAARAAELAGLHAAWADRFNLGLRRAPWWYEHYVARTYFGPTVHVYRYDAPGGGAEGYVLFSYAKPQYRARLVVRDLVSTTPRARAALLAFLGDQDSQTDEIELRLPATDPLLAQLGSYEQCWIRTQLHNLAMARVVDVRAALSGWTDLAGDDAEVVVDVDDEHAGWNRGRWGVEVRAGASSVSATRRPADVRVSVQSLAQLLVGFVDPVAAFDAGLVTGPRVERAELLARFAGGRAPFHHDYY